MDITYNRQHNDSFMIIEQIGNPDGYEIRMVQENDIMALLDISVMQINGKNSWYYNISRKESLIDYIESGNLTVDSLERIVLYLQLCFDELDKYLISQNHIYLTGETIFLEKGHDTFSVKLCFTSTENESVGNQFRHVLEEMMAVVDADDKRLMESLYRIYDVAVREEYTFQELLDIIREDNEEPQLHIEHVELDEAKPAYIEEMELSEEEEHNLEMTESFNNRDGEYLSDYYQEDYFDKPGIIERFTMLFKGIKSPKSYQTQRQYEDFIVDPDYELGERTVLLTDNKQKCMGKLIYDGENGEDSFVINKDIFKIGTSKKCDGIIHSRAVSANHAKIIRENDNYYLEDLNSLNGSTVSGKVANYHDHIKLKPMDVIKLADVPYVFL